jgi:thiamine-phosphate pyrophosphorylase
MVAAAPLCRLYLVLPVRPPASFEMLLERVIIESEPACVLLLDDAGRARPDPARDARLREITAARDVALLVENDAERAQLIGADGVHLPPDAALFRQARERLGQRAIIGIGCIESRHDAMIMAELGADYVAFGAPGTNGAALDRQAELIAWWSEIFVIPSVAFEVETPEAAARLAGLGADFVAPAPTLWQSDEALERIGRIAAALRPGRTAA